MKGLMIFSDNMEDVESLGTRALLRRAGLDIISATYQDTLEVITAFGQKILADGFLKDVHVDDYDLLIIPGGKYVAMTIDHHTEIQRIAKSFHAKKKRIAAICAGPRFLGRAGLLDGKTYTAFTGSNVDAPLGIYKPECKAIRDGQIITARGAGAVYEFAYEIVKDTLGETKAKGLLENILF